jgi:hypothetical protein
LDDHRIIVHEVNFSIDQLSSRNGKTSSGAFQLHVSVVDAGSGTTLLGKDWQTGPTGSLVYVTSGGLLVKTGDIFRSLSEQLNEIKQFPVSTRDPGEGWEMRVSPTGKTILFNHYLQEWSGGNGRRNFSDFELLDGERFEVKYKWTEIPALHDDKLYSISDASMVIDDHLHEPDHIIASQFGSRKWQSIGEQPKKTCLRPAILAWIADDSLVYGCEEFSVISNGHVVMTDRFDEGEELIANKFSMTRDGRFVAISLQHLRGGFFDTERRTASIRVVIYDLSLKRRALTLKITPLPQSNYDLALSPDGSKLAVLNDRNLAAYSVPVE